MIQINIESGKYTKIYRIIKAYTIHENMKQTCCKTQKVSADAEVDDDDDDDDDEDQVFIC